MTTTTPRRIPRLLARAPIAVFRLGLGGLFGGRLVMVDHRGRKSGLVRRVVLETVARDGAARIVVSGYGWSSQWLRNIRADPRVRLWAGWGTGRPARAAILPPAEAVAVLEAYRQEHPGAAKALGRALRLDQLAEDGPLTTEQVEDLPVVRITPR